ncbi:hypothetical protein Gasu2_02600 [Galdieria sulphuraria]|nr:hypothetical protein Gasu2_02600 [Galdieria sulphuraria]
MLFECLFEDPDIVFWTRFLSGVQLEKFYLLLTDWFEKNSQCPKLFVIHVQHGLGNRLRALASALAYVELIPHIPILIWECDHHMGAKWEDLFEDLSNVVISPVEDESLLKNPFAHLLEKCLFITCCWLPVSADNPSLSLFVILENCPREPFIGFHIRQRLLHEEKFVTKNPQLEYGYFSARIIDKYRNSYLSYEQLFHCVQNKIAVDHRRLLPLSISTCENRSRLCIQKALVDLYCLSQSNLLFGKFNVVVVTDFKNLKTALQPKKKGNSQQPLGKLLRDSHLIYEAMSNYLKAQFLLDED